MTELEALQAKRREEAARKRANLKERKARTRRLIQRGAILENALNDYIQSDNTSNDDIVKFFYIARQPPSTPQPKTTI